MLLVIINLKTRFLNIIKISMSIEENSLNEFHNWIFILKNNFYLDSLIIKIISKIENNLNLNF